jgi:Lon protease-like protein
MTGSERTRIPIFPLPGVVLFPGTLLPLHIFEPRYQVMVSQALAGDRMIGMSMLDGTGTPADPPAVLPLGGAGRIVEQERLDDGRFNIILEGVYRYRILREEPSAPYRTATVEVIPAAGFSEAEGESGAVSAALAIFGELQEAMQLPPLPSESTSAERLSGELALRLRWPPDALQGILAMDSLGERFEAITARLSEWKEMTDFLRPFRAETNPLFN